MIFRVLAALAMIGAGLSIAGCVEVVDKDPGQFFPAPGTDKVQYCSQIAPDAQFPDGLVTTMSARLVTSHDLRDISVVRSSGHADFDQLAVNCAAKAPIRPALKDGVPIEITWTFELRWHANDHSFVTIKRPPGYPITCANFYPAQAIAAGEQGVTIVSFEIGTDGSVKTPVIARSSGFPDLDEAAKSCVLAWHYLPATFDGKPVEFDWRAQVLWTTR
jgi:TonB family protein